ncbi:ATP-binding protein [Labrenzia sp. VG12]|uniref:sensor histidine kinase n=1 Tax=Labrenzia sp. VG12 TaxID=2021862 RepID=UPI000B8C10D1|nr:ATP-binding protein [Labrenzia sp. VG12]ASP35654.1 two-component sensor histidine kinase [Labrenzia sp. VG12]
MIHPFRKLFAPFLMRRLYLQIYGVMLASLLLVVILSALLWEVYGRDRVNRDVLDSISRFVALTLPPPGASIATQQATIERLGQDLELELKMFDASGRLIAKWGDPDMPDDRFHGQTGWFRAHGGPVVALSLPDGRWLVADAERRPGAAPVVNLLAALALIGLCVGVGVYPVARRLTKRLEQLQEGVERIGAGDLKARVDVKGLDEVSQLARSFNASADKIDKLVSAHRLLLANASHELRTPLARIKLGLEMEQDRPSEERQQALKQDIADLNALIEEILMMSRLDAAMPLDSREPVDLLALIAEECARFEGCSFSGTAPEIEGDPRLLHRMLANLLENGLKHGIQPVTVTLSSSANVVTLDVCDQGPGISMAERETVFQPFYRGPDRQNIDGYGLGLPLVRKIAQAHGGWADVVAVTGGKTSVRVTLPSSP